MFYKQLKDQQVAPPTIFISGTKSPLTKAFVLLVPFSTRRTQMMTYAYRGVTLGICSTVQKRTQYTNGDF